jgi:hypothetical protein
VERSSDTITEIQRQLDLSNFSATLTTETGTGIDTGAALRALTQSQWGTTIIAEFTFTRRFPAFGT